MSGEITALELLRHTPAGLPLLSFRLTHQSVQVEANIERQAELEIEAVAVGDICSSVARFGLGDRVAVQGFLAAKRRTSPQNRVHSGSKLILHVTHIKPFGD